jgi:hypothetical protein
MEQPVAGFADRASPCLIVRFRRSMVRQWTSSKTFVGERCHYPFAIKELCVIRLAQVLRETNQSDGNSNVQGVGCGYAIEEWNLRWLDWEKIFDMRCGSSIRIPRSPS